MIILKDRILNKGIFIGYLYKVILYKLIYEIILLKRFVLTNRIRLICD